jgi:hypothetical protein
VRPRLKFYAVRTILLLLNVLVGTLAGRTNDLHIVLIVIVAMIPINIILVLKSI